MFEKTWKSVGLKKFSLLVDLVVHNWKSSHFCIFFSFYFSEPNVEQSCISDHISFFFSTMQKRLSIKLRGETRYLGWPVHEWLQLRKAPRKTFPSILVTSQGSRHVQAGLTLTPWPNLHQCLLCFMHKKPLSVSRLNCFFMWSKFDGNLELLCKMLGFFFSL